MEYKLTFEQYQQGLRAGKILGLRCEHCAAYTFPPQGVCRDCGSHNLRVAEMKGEGTIRTFTVIRIAPEGFQPPYVVALVELDEGSWVTGNLLGINPDEADMSLLGRKVSLGSQPVKTVADPGGDLRVLTFALM